MTPTNLFQTKCFRKVFERNLLQTEFKFNQFYFIINWTSFKIKKNIFNVLF